MRQAHKKLFTWALAPTATRTRARAAGKNFIVSMGILEVERLESQRMWKECRVGGGNE